MLLTAGAIINRDVVGTAQIAQSKLNLNAATTRANATGISQSDLGSASFDSAKFTITDGWVTTATGSIHYQILKLLQLILFLVRSAAGSWSS